MSSIVETFERLCRAFVFVPQYDELSGVDLCRRATDTISMLQNALADKRCACVNTLGFMKPKIARIAKSGFMQGAHDGLYIKVSALLALKTTDPLLAKTIEAFCVQLTFRADIQPLVQNNGFWMQPLVLYEKLHHTQELYSIARTHSQYVDGSYFQVLLDQSPFSNADSQTKQRNLYELARDAREIIEVGFNAGFSCLLMLIANRESRITVVDINEHAYVVPCFEYLNANFPGRLTLRLGSSHDVLPLLEERKCDLIHIDGAHTFEDSRLDFQDLLPMVKEETVVLMDDVSVDGVNQVYQRMMHLLSMTKEPMCETFVWGHGACRATKETASTLDRIRAARLPWRSVWYETREQLLSALGSQK